MGPIEIKVTQSADGKLRAEPIAPKASPGDTVTWIFEGELADKKLKVSSKDRSKDFPKDSQSKQISVQLFKNGEPDFEYVILDDKDQPIDWEDGGKGECVKHPDPPPSTKAKPNG